ncbi:MAG: hypothetical protein DME85_14100 [Verrucomicrobia bacterium]|nr:MAG: hypothetical protein DME85_14100 [Verrucomicrobiota bacterium]
MIDCVYVATGLHDSRFTRICVASIRFFYPNIPIRLLLGGAMRPRFLDELKCMYNVETAAVSPGNYGWGFIKLEPLFQDRPERFLILDSDTVLLGPVLETANNHQTDFIVDFEQQTDSRAKEIYFNWEIGEQSGFGMAQPDFLFNTGQWFACSRVLRRADFDPWIRWSLPPRLTRPDLFKNGEQGILNFVVNEQYQKGSITVTRVPLMRWPGFDVTDIKLPEVTRGHESPYRQVMHWAGFKAPRFESLPRSDLLIHFERLYYEDHGGGGERLRLARARRYAREYRTRRFAIKLKQRLQRVMRS